MGTLLEKTPQVNTQQVCRKNYKPFLKNVSLFSDFPERALDQVLQNTIIKDYKKGHSLFLVGDTADFFYIIINGWIKLFRTTRDGHESVIAVLANGDMFGRCAVLKNGSFPYSAEVITDLRVLMIPSNFMLHMAEHHTEYDDFLNHFLEGELNEHNRKNLEAEHLVHMTSAERVGCFLLQICGNRREGSVTFQFPYEKALVAGRLGMTPETFSRSLNQLTSLGVETQNTYVTIHNIEQLQARVCEHCSATMKDCFLAEEDEEAA